MKILVSGATGFIGSHVVDKLLAKGYDIRCMVRKTSNLRWLENKNIELVYASLSDVDSLKNATQNVDYIYHIAGNTSAKNLDGYMYGNCTGTINLIEAALSSAPKLSRFLYVSSQTAAGPALSKMHPSTEDMLMHPLTSYGKSKKAAEEAVNSYSGKLPFTIVRPPAVYGPRDTEILAIFKMIKAGLIAYMGFDEKYVSLIHSDDLARGMIEAAESRNTIGKTYFISSDVFYSWHQVYEIIKKELNKKYTLNLRLPHFLILAAGSISGALGKFSSKPPVFNYEKGIDFTQKYWICSTASARKDFGYTQQIPLEHGIHDTVQWYKANGWL